MTFILHRSTRSHLCMQMENERKILIFSLNIDSMLTESHRRFDFWDKKNILGIWIYPRTWTSDRERSWKKFVEKGHYNVLYVVCCLILSPDQQRIDKFGLQYLNVIVDAHLSVFSVSSTFKKRVLSQRRNVFQNIRTAIQMIEAEPPFWSVDVEA